MMEVTDNSIDCPKCGAHFTPGEEIILPLSKIFRATSKENARVNANRIRREHQKRIYVRKTKGHSTGFYAVTRVPISKRKPRGSWRYRSISNGINIQRVDLRDLKRAVEKRGGDWKIVDKESAKRSIEENRRVIDDV